MRWRSLSPRRRLAIAVTAVVIALVLLLVPGGVDRYDGERAGAPSWTEPCWARAPRTDRTMLSRCARVTGRVVWVRREGIGATSKADIVISEHFRVTIAKLAPYTGRTVPAIGDRVTIVGPLVRSKVGVREVQFFAQQ